MMTTRSGYLATSVSLWRRLRSSYSTAAWSKTSKSSSGVHDVELTTNLGLFFVMHACVPLRNRSHTSFSRATGDALSAAAGRSRVQNARGPSATAAASRNRSAALSFTTTASSIPSSSRKKSRIAFVTHMCFAGQYAPSVRSYHSQNFVARLARPCLSPKSVYPKLCQSITMRIPRRLHANPHAKNVGIHGGFCINTSLGRGRIVKSAYNKCAHCAAARAINASAVGQFAVIDHSPVVTSTRLTPSCSTISRIGVVPRVETTTTSRSASSASDSAWYCIRGERPKSPMTTTAVVARGGRSAFVDAFVIASFVVGTRSRTARRTRARVRRMGANLNWIVTFFN